MFPQSIHLPMVTNHQRSPLFRELVLPHLHNGRAGLDDPDWGAVGAGHCEDFGLATPDCCALDGVAVGLVGGWATDEKEEEEKRGRGEERSVLCEATHPARCGGSYSPSPLFTSAPPGLPTPAILSSLSLIKGLKSSSCPLIHRAVIALVVL